jgi:hypothetical protein
MALLLALLSAGARAEDMKVTVTQITDPILYMDGEPYFDLSGLTLQIAQGSTADGAIAQYFIDLYAGDENINSAMLQKSGDMVSFLLGGMQSAYSMPADDFEAEFGSLEGGALGGPDGFNFDEWALPGDVGELILAFIDEHADPAGAREIGVSLAAGESTMTQVSFSGVCTQLLRDIALKMDQDVLLSGLIASMDVEYPSYAYFLRATDFRANLEGSIAQTADGQSVLVALKLEVAQSGAHTFYNLDLLADGSESVRQVSLKYMQIESEITETIQLDGTIDAEALDFTATVIDDAADDYYDALYDVRFTLTPGRDAASGADSFALTILEKYENVKLTVEGSMAERTGETHLTFALTDRYDDMRAYFSYLPDEKPDDGAVSSGVLEIGADDGFGSYGLTCGVRTSETTLDSDEFYIDPVNTIDLSDMSTAAEQAALNELESVLFDTLNQLEDAVPGLAGIVDELFGYTYDEVF